MDESLTATVFINTILGTGEMCHLPDLQTADGVSPRQKRRHNKSRRGCIECKRRKVKCDERQPCAGCTKRGVKCLQPVSQPAAARLARPSPHMELDLNPNISLLQLELFYHWDHQTRWTLVFPQVWPVIMGQAFQEEFVMGAILCTSAMHLSHLCPRVTKYAHIGTRLMDRTISLFRQSLSRPVMHTRCEAIIGVALLINYISWSDLSFLDESNAVSSLAQDHLLLLSPGTLQTWFQTIPHLIDSNSVFISVMYQHPRREIEHFLERRGYDMDLFVEPMMRLWNNPQYQRFADGPEEDLVHGPATQGAWRLLVQLDKELPPKALACESEPMWRDHSENDRLQYFRGAVARITANSMAGLQPLSSSERASFEYITRRLAPLFCCASLASDPSQAPAGNIDVIQTDIEQLLYGFPILFCGPLTDLVQRGDSRALLVLFLFYRSVRLLSDPKRGWWALARSERMEMLILDELKARKLDEIVCADMHLTVGS